MADSVGVPAGVIVAESDRELLGVAGGVPVAVIVAEPADNVIDEVCVALPVEDELTLIDADELVEKVCV